MANKETRVLKQDTLEILRQKTNEISLHVGDNEQLDALLADKTYSYTASAGQVLFDGADNNSKVTRFELSPQHTIDNTGGSIILEGVSSLDSSYVANANIYQGSSGSETWQASIVSATTNKIIVRDSSGTFSTSEDLKVGSSSPDTIANAKIARIIIESYPVAIARVYNNNTELTQGMVTNGFFAPKIVGVSSITGSPSVGNAFSEGVTVYQNGSALNTQGDIESDSNWYGVLHSVDSGEIRFKTSQGSFSATAKLRVLGSSDEIAAANHGALTAVDSTYGSYIELTTPAANTNVIKVFSLDLVAAINELQHDIGTVENLSTTNTDVVLAINEHDSELGTITASAMATTASTVSGAIREHEDQIGNVDITGISGSNNTITGALEQIHNEIGDVTASNLGTSASNLTAAVREHEDQIGSANINSISGTDNTITTALNQLHTEIGSSSITDNLPSDFTYTTTDHTTAINTMSSFIGDSSIANIGSTDTVTGALQSLHGEIGTASFANDLPSEHTYATGSQNLTGQIDGIVGFIGNTSLLTDHKTTLVGSINELETNLRGNDTNYVIDNNLHSEASLTRNNGLFEAFNDLTLFTGNTSIANIGTTDTLTGALQSLHGEIGTNVFGSGGPADTIDASNLTSAVNAIDAEIGDTSYGGGDLTTAIKNIQDDISVAGSLTTLNTTNKFLVGAINELDAEIFNSASSGDRRTLSSLSTADKTSIVDAINEIYADIHTSGSVTLDTAASHLVGAINEIEGVFDASAHQISAGTNGFGITSGTFAINASGAILLNSDGNITLDNGTNHTILKVDGTEYGRFTKSGSDFQLKAGNLGALFLTASGQDATFARDLDVSQDLTVTRNLIVNGTGEGINVDIAGDVDIDGTTNLDNTIIAGTLTLNSTALSSTFVELNVMDGNTSATSTTIVDADRVVVNDDGTMKQVAVTDLAAYFDDEITNMPNLASAAVLATVGTLNSGSITSGFGSIDVGSSSIDGGTITAATAFVIGNANITQTELERIDGLTPGTVTASKVIAVNANKDFGSFRDITSGRNITISGEFDGATLDLSSTADIAGVVTISNTTQSSLSSATDGALVVAGGASIAKNLYVGGDLTVKGTQTILNTETLTVEDTLVLAGNNLSSEPSSGGFGLEVGPITSPSGVASGVTGAHSIVYNYSTDQWEADGSLILSSATLGTPSIEGTDFGSSQDLAFSAGAGLSEAVTGLSGNNFVVTYTNTDRGSSQNIFKTVAPSSGANATADVNSDTLNLTQGSGISTVGSGDNIITISNTDKGSSQFIFKNVVAGGVTVVADSNNDTLTFTDDNVVNALAVANTDTIALSHADVFTGTAGDFGQTGTQDGKYIKSLTLTAEGHISAITTGDFDTRYEASDPSWTLKVNDTSVDPVNNGDSVDFRLAEVDSTAGLTIGSSTSSGDSIITLGHANTSDITNLTSNNSGGTVIQDLVLTYDTYGHALTRSVTTTNLDSRYIRSFVVQDGDTTDVTINQANVLKFVEAAGDGASININWTDTSPGSSGDPYDLSFSVTNTDKGSVAANALRIFKNVASDSGTAVADTNADTLTIAGGTNINTAVVGDTLTINNEYTYTHPTYNGDDFSIDTGPLTGATVISDLDINVTTDSIGSVVDANGTVATRNLIPGDLGIYGWDLHGNGSSSPIVNNILNDQVDFVNGNHTTAVVTNPSANNGRVKFNHNTFTSGGTYVGGSNNGIVIEGFHYDSYGHVRSVQTRDLDSRFDNYNEWRLQDNDDATSSYGHVDSTEYVKFINGTNTTTVRGGSGSSSDPHTIRVNVTGVQLTSSPATFFCVQNSGSNNNPKLQLSDQSNVDPVTIVGGTNVTVTRNSNTQLTISATDNNTDVDVSVSNLETRLGQINSNINIGDPNVDPDVTVPGDLIVGGDLTVSGSVTTINTETVTIQDNIILLNSNSAGNPTENAGIQVERGNSSNYNLIWNESDDRWKFQDSTGYHNIPRSNEYMSNWKVSTDLSTDQTITNSEVLGIRGGTALETLIATTESGESHTLEVKHSDVNRTNNNASAVTLDYGDDFAIVSVLASNNQGHVTGVTTQQLTLPDAYSLPLATSSVRGGVKIGAQVSGTRNYAIALDNNERMFVNVPWTDTNTFRTVSVDTNGDGSVNNTLEATETLVLKKGSNISLSESGGVVTISAAAYSLPLASSSTRGGVKVGYTENGKNYPVELSSEKMFVNVPWTDTNTNRLTTFVVEDGDSTDVTISHDKHWKFVEGSENVNADGNNYIQINWTDTSTGSSSDEYDLSFSHKRTARSNSTNGSGTTTFGGSFTIVDGVTTNATGHVTGVNTKTITMPANPNTDTNRFLLSTATVDNGSDMILRYNMTNDGTNVSDAIDVGITAGSGITLTPGTNTFEIKGKVYTATVRDNDDTTSDVTLRLTDESGGTQDIEFAGNSNITFNKHSGGGIEALIASNSVGNAKLADMAEGTIKGRVASGTGNPGDLGPAEVRTLLNVANGAEVNQNAFAYVYANTYDASTQTGTNVAVLSADSKLDSFTIETGHGFTTSASSSNDSLTINRNNDWRTRYDNDNAYVGNKSKEHIHFDPAGNIKFYSDGAENARLNSTGQLLVHDDIVAFSTSVSSDVKLKENIERVEGALDKVSQLDGVTFNWKKDGKASAGVIAQNVEEVLPSAVKEVEALDGEEINKHVDYNQLSALFIEAIKELKQENKLLRDEIENLKSINS